MLLYVLAFCASFDRHGVEALRCPSTEGEKLAALLVELFMALVALYEFGHASLHRFHRELAGREEFLRFMMRDCVWHNRAAETAPQIRLLLLAFIATELVLSLIEQPDFRY